VRQTSLQKTLRAGHPRRPFGRTVARDGHTTR